MNSKYEPCELKPYIEQVRGIAYKPKDIAKKPFDGSVPILKANNITDTGLDESSLIYIDAKKVKSEQFINVGDILLAASSGSKKVIGKNIFFDDSYYGSFGAFCKLVRPKPQLNARFLKHFFKTRYYRNSIERSVQGANINNLRNEHLDNLEIPLPPLDDQKRIAYLLGKVEALIARRKEHLQQLNDLLKSVFLEMFGDPVRNEKGWETKPFGDLLVNIDSGTSPKCEARIAQDTEWGVLKLGAVTSCHYNDQENKALPHDLEPNVQSEVKSGDVLFSRKNTFELVAACAYVFHTRPKLLLPDLIFRFVIKKEEQINSIFLWKLLIADTQRKIIQATAAGTAGSMPNISKAKLRKILLPIPPPDLQNQFAAIVEKVEALKSRYQQSLADLESLYGALSQKAFKGELDLSRVPLPTEPTTEDTEGTEENHESHEKHEIGDVTLPLAGQQQPAGK